MVRKEEKTKWGKQIVSLDGKRGEKNEIVLKLSHKNEHRQDNSRGWKETVKTARINVWREPRMNYRNRKGRRRTIC